MHVALQVLQQQACLELSIEGMSLVVDKSGSKHTDSALYLTQMNGFNQAFLVQIYLCTREAVNAGSPFLHHVPCEQLLLVCWTAHAPPPFFEQQMNLGGICHTA